MHNLYIREPECSHPINLHDKACRMNQLTSSERSFFTLVHQAVYANPFSDHRSRVDREIAGLISESGGDGEFEATLSQVRHHIDRLEHQGRATITHYDQHDQELLTSSFLFDLFHRYTDRFDRLILDQLQAGEQPLPAPFAVEAIDQLNCWGIDRETAGRYVAMCYQLRRAFFFIDKNLKGRSDSMRRLREDLWNNVFTHNMGLYHRYLWNRMEDFSTMLLGETGSGKGAAAMAIGRSGFIPFDEKKGCFQESFTRSFTALNLSQFPATLIESELFGHRKGAFTGAVENYEGIFDRCSPHGAIFLDEIGEVVESIQIKLLQVIQERFFKRVGDHRARPFRGRVIAATNRPAEQLISSRAMREDFYYRLCSDLIVVPSLMQRIQEDPAELEDLLEVVVERIVGEPSSELVALVADQISQTPGSDYTWPGNVRELEQCVRRILLKQSYSPLPTRASKDLLSNLQAGLGKQTLDVKTLVTGYCFTLYQSHGTIEAVARIAGLDRRTAKKHIDTGRQRFALTNA
jgi:DNA-binding NtrC family response regulator